jgi:putative ABC transport system permease protein
MDEAARYAAMRARPIEPRPGGMKIVLVGELATLVLLALPVGLLFGRGLALFIMSSFSTETVRLPIVISTATYSIAAIVVCSAAIASFALVSRLLGKLDLVGVLKARD